MRHGNQKFKFSMTSSHRKAMMKNLASELIDHGKIHTTETKARALRSYVEKLITLAKEDTIANRRVANTKLGNKAAVKSLFENVAPKFKQRPGGYTRILKMADSRLGDGAKTAYLALVE
jgi:large subunit ribosomal protein L17